MNMINKVLKLKIQFGVIKLECVYMILCFYIKCFNVYIIKVLLYLNSLFIYFQYYCLEEIKLELNNYYLFYEFFFYILEIKKN